MDDNDNNCTNASTANRGSKSIDTVTKIKQGENDYDGEEEEEGNVIFDNSNSPTTIPVLEKQDPNNNNNDDDDDDAYIDEEQRRHKICCSVLTTVIDYSMILPTELYEPREYYENCITSSSSTTTTTTSIRTSSGLDEKGNRGGGILGSRESIPSTTTTTIKTTSQQQQQDESLLLLVPVMRIFGPIVRRDQYRNTTFTTTTTTNFNHHHPKDITCSRRTSTNLHCKPYQSVCLYIHGVYPYLLARPVMAGLDGSCTTSTTNTVGSSSSSSSNNNTSSSSSSFNNDDDDSKNNDGNNTSNSSRCTWDSPYHVQKMIPVLHALLEQAVQETSIHFMKQQNTSDNGTSSKTDDSNDTNQATKSAKQSTERFMDNDTTTISNQSKYPKQGQQQQQQLCRKIIRQITIVMGRGFYGYCCGSTAPFLKIEYYSPNDRWKIKRCLEYGLSFSNDTNTTTTTTVQYENGIPFTKISTTNDPPPPPPDPLPIDFYFPKQRYNNSNHSNNNLNDNNDTSILKFHCFEAHIPYTMQFFKDYNLSGMSYIHISEPRTTTTTATNDQTIIDDCPYETKPIKFRTPLPSSVRSTRGGCNNSSENQTFQPWIFLNTNTPNEYVWKNEMNTLADDDMVKKVHVKDNNNKTIRGTDTSTVKKMTSCDVELDIHVSNIVNQYDVMTQLPSQDEVRQRIHWRAVPSLQEIWKQERRRMSKLLPPKEDFLSYNDSQNNISLSNVSDHINDESKKKVHFTPPFTLNVKAEDRVQSGTKLACEGMKNLLHVTDGLESNFRRAMQQIVQRYTKSIHKTDTKILRKNQQCAQHNDKAISENLTPSYDETMEALDALGTLFTETSPAVVRQVEDMGDIKDRSMIVYEEKLSQESALSRGESTSAASMVHSSQATSEKLLATLSQACSSTMVHQVRDTSLIDEYVLSQRIDRGDGIVGNHFDNIEDVINPETLTPYDKFDDEDDEDDDDDDDVINIHEEAADVIEVMSDIDKNNELGEKRVTIPEGNRPTADYDDSSSVDSFELLKRHESRKSDHDDENLYHPETAITLGSGTAGANEHLDSNEQRATEIPVVRDVPELSNIDVKSTVASKYVKEIEKTLTNIHPVPDGNDAGLACIVNLSQTNVKETDWKWSLHFKQNGMDLEPTFYAPCRSDVESWGVKQMNLRAKRSMSAFESDINSKKCRKSSFPHKSPSVNANIPLLSASYNNINNVEEVGWQDFKSPTPAVNHNVDPTQSHMNQVLIKQDEGDSQLSTEPKFSLQLSCNEKQLGAKSSNQCSTSDTLLQGLGSRGGKLLVEQGGELKAKIMNSQVNYQNSIMPNDSLKSPVSIMTIEIFVQCRTGRAGISDSTMIAMTPDSSRDKISAVAYVVSEDPGGGDPLLYQERGCIFLPVNRELDPSLHSGIGTLDNIASGVRKSLPETTLGVSTPLTVECVRDERQLLLRLASIVRRKDPDMLLSWDTQAYGLGYIIERGATVGKECATSQDGTREIDMARLLGRTPTISVNNSVGSFQRNFESSDAGDEFQSEMNQVDSKSTNRWVGSGLGAEWDERVGAGAAAASISGRLVFSAWKIIADEVKHPNCKYLPAVVSSVLNRRIPFHDNLKLGEWYGHHQGRQRWRVLHNTLVQAMACLQLFDALDIVGRSGEAARLSGVEFSQSFPGIRGSQYKVEGVLLRALQSLSSKERGSKYGQRKANSPICARTGLSVDSKSQTQSPWKVRRQRELSCSMEGPSILHDLSDRCYFFFSPSLSDTTRQEALETQPLTLEPLSGHQLDPVIVCDFTALYPSLVIAYNLCYSTIAGKLEYHSTRTEMQLDGKTTGKIGPVHYDEEITATVLSHHMKSLFGETNLRDRSYASPTGAVYVAETVVKGVLPQVLDEMLSTRAMLKKAAKQYKKHVPNLSPAILRQLEARQLALKYVANVTYGYTSATFSGRCAMPLLADTIVECGRRTLTNAIIIANQWGQDTSNKWSGIKVLYGDTDSVFIALPGRSVNEAFSFGEEFCKVVTESNPPPVQLKLEKVYLGSMMQTKKRYAGMKFDSKDEQVPTFEAKGIETVRRDQCLLTKKILRNSLIMLYRSGIDAVKSYLFRQWNTILSGKLPVSDFILTGRVRSRYRGGKIGPVQAALVRRLAEADPAKHVLHNERQAYVIVATPGTAFKLRDCVLTPMELLEQWDAFTIHTTYYITKHVNAALQRCLGLAPYHVDVASWFEVCPKPRHRIHFWPSTASRQSNITISTFFGSDKCSVCGRKCKATSRSKAAVCSECLNDSMKLTILSMERLNNIQEEAFLLAQKCKSCNLCFEDASTFATVRKISDKALTKNTNTTSMLVTPLANCCCIDCPITFERHRLRENELEAIAICEAI